MPRPTLTSQQFYSLVDNKETKAVEKALIQSSDSMRRDYFKAANSIKETALLLSSRLGYTDMVGVLLDYGAPLYDTDKDEDNVLHSAALHSNAQEVFEVLFSKRDCTSLLTMKNKSHYIPFQTCLTRAHGGPLVEFLIDNTQSMELLGLYHDSVAQLPHIIFDPRDMIEAKINILKENFLLNNLAPRQNAEKQKPIGHNAGFKI